jgi:hypothetical protein
MASLIRRFNARSASFFVFLRLICAGSTRGRGRGVCDLGDRGDVDRGVQLTVAAWFQAVAHTRSGGRFSGVVPL